MIMCYNIICIYSKQSMNGTFTCIDPQTTPICQCSYKYASPMGCLRILSRFCADS